MINKLTTELNGKIEQAKGELQVLGIEKLDDSSVVYRLTQEVKSMKQFEVERFLRKKKRSL